MTITITPKWVDLYWMNQDSWTARATLIVGALWLGTAPFEPDPATTAAYALAVIGFSLLALPAYGIWLTRSYSVVGRHVHLHLDDWGVRGWPLRDDEYRTWDKAHRVWARPGVIIIQFGRTPGSRGGRIVIPSRDLGPTQQKSLRALLIEKNLVRTKHPGAPRRAVSRLAGRFRP
jgi:hypothetical protein